MRLQSKMSLWRSPRLFFPAILAGSIFAMPLAQVAYSADPFVRVGLFIEEEKPGEDSVVVERFSFAPTIPPGDGKFLRLYADSNAPAAFVVLAVDRATRDVATEWCPVIWLHQKGFSDTVFPAPEEKGIPYQSGTALDLFVVRIPLNYGDLKSIEDNITQLAGMEGEDKKQLFLLKAGSIRERVDGWFQNQNQEKCVPQYRPPARAATQRSGSAASILWREKHLVHLFPVENPDRPFVIQIPVKPEEVSDRNVKPTAK